MKWIWTFGIGTPYKGKYVVIETDNDDGREYMFDRYGRMNCCMSYPYDKGMELVKKYGYQLIENIKMCNVIQDGNYFGGYVIHKIILNDFYTADIVSYNECELKHNESYELMGDDNDDNNKR